MADIEKAKKFVLWGGWYGSRNVGDRLLLLTITDLLWRAFGKCEFTILTANPGFVEEYFHPKHNLSYQIIRPKKDVFKLLYQIATCHAVILGGGAPFFDQYKQAFYVSLIAVMARIFGKPYILWCITSFEIHRKIIRTLYRKVIDGAKNATCRDKYTVAIFSSLGIKYLPEVVKDSGFSLQDIDYKDAGRLASKYLPDPIPPRLFGLTPRALSNNAEARTHYNKKGAKAIQHQIDVYSIALDWLVANGYTPVFIPMNTQPLDDDRIAARQIVDSSKWGKHSIIIDEIVMPRTAPALYSFCFGSLVSRVHGSVTSFLGNCPPIMYAFEKKHVGIMESMELDQLIFDTSNEPKAIISLLEKLERNQSVIKGNMLSNKMLLDEKAHVPCETIKQTL